ARWLPRFGWLALLASACIEIPPPPSTGQHSVRITRYDPAATPTLVAWDVSPPLRDIRPLPASGRFERERERHPPILQLATPSFVDPAAQPASGPEPIAARVATSDGIGRGFPGRAGPFNEIAAPPDTNGDVGLNHYVQTVNISFAVFSKTGTPVYGPASIK